MKETTWRNYFFATLLLQYIFCTIVTKINLFFNSSLMYQIFLISIRSFPEKEPKEYEQLRKQRRKNIRRFVGTVAMSVKRIVLN